MKRTMLSVQATPDTTHIRTATLFEEEHTVIPCVALVEGVLWPANAPAPELALAEEFGRFPDGWNGRPVVYDHPHVNGMAVSASHPDVLEDVGIGTIFSTKVNNNKLILELWINNARVETMSQEIQDTVTRLKEGDETVEVSTGLFTMTENSSGEYNGESFEAIWRNIVPDHLAILPEGVVGACSVEDGCGAPRSNKSTPDKVVYTAKARDHDFVPVMRAAHMNTDNNTAVAKITATGEGECGCADVTDCQCEEPKKGIFQKIMEFAGNALQFTDNSANLSDADTRTAVQSALAASEDFFWIMAIFDGGDSSGLVVYEDFMSGKLFEREFTITDNTVTIGDAKTEVRPVTQFVAVQPEAEVTDNSDASESIAADTTQLQENSTMNKDQLVQGLIDNKSSQFSEDDRDWLSTLEESQLAKLSPVEVEESDDEVTDNIGTVVGGADAVAEADVAPISTDDYIAGAPEEVQAVLNSGLRMHRQRKAALVKGLLANKRCTFNAAQLEGKPLEELEAIAILAGEEVSYEANAIRDNSNRADDNAPPAPIQLFDLSKSVTA